MNKQSIEPMKIANPTQPGKLLTDFALIYLDTMVTPNGNDLGFRVAIQDSTIHGDEILFSSLDTVSKILAERVHNPFMMALGQDVQKAIDKMAVTMQKVEEAQKLGAEAADEE